MARKRKGGRRIKRKTQKKDDQADENADGAPRAFVFTKGKVPASVIADGLAGVTVHEVKGAACPCRVVCIARHSNS